MSKKSKKKELKAAYKAYRQWMLYGQEAHSVLLDIWRSLVSDSEYGTYGQDPRVVWEEYLKNLERMREDLKRPYPKVEEVASVIWETSRWDEGTISATGANVVARAVLPLFETAEMYNEDTLFKVKQALEQAKLSEIQVVSSINEMQNAGILFRERV